MYFYVRGDHVFFLQAVEGGRGISTSSAYKQSHTLMLMVNSTNLWNHSNKLATYLWNHILALLHISKD